MELGIRKCWVSISALIFSSIPMIYHKDLFDNKLFPYNFYCYIFDKYFLHLRFQQHWRWNNFRKWNKRKKLDFDERLVRLHIHVYLSNATIKITNALKLLGLLLDNKMLFNENTNNKINKETKKEQRFFVSCNLFYCIGAYLSFSSFP